MLFNFNKKSVHCKKLGVNLDPCKKKAVQAKK